MPCKCSGLRADRCKCRLVRAGYSRGRDEPNLVLLAHTSGTCWSRDMTASTEPNMLITLLENLYDKCAGYNLRYCPIRGYANNKNHIGNTAKDLLTLACFLVANLVVLLAILTKTTVHMFYVFRQTINWAKSYFSPTIVEGREVWPVLASKPSIRHDLNPPFTYKFN